MTGVFVTGTDTGIGKTVVSACLAARWDAWYWKPVQTGLATDPSDTETVQHLAALPASRCLAPAHAFQAPLSPEAAGALEGVTPRLEDFALPAHSPLVVEGAGGLLVPLGGGALLIDLMARLGLPVLLVARATLGTINHTLLSLEALRGRALQVAGVVMVGPPSPGNRRAIEHHGRIEVLAELPWAAAPTPALVQTWAAGFPPAPPDATGHFSPG